MHSFIADDREDRLYAIDERLRERFGTAPLGNLADPLDELIYIQLSIRTRERTYQGVFDDLKRAVGGQWDRLLELPERDLVTVLTRAGMARVKLGRLRAQLEEIQRRLGSVSLDALTEWSDEKAEAFLVSLPGVGPKAARCVLLYALNRRVFPVDSHCLRILVRLGIVSADLDRRRAHDVVQEIIPRHIRHSLHVNFVHHGRELCLPRSPLCSACPILDLCPTGKRTRPTATVIR